MEFKKKILKNLTILTFVLGFIDFITLWRAVLVRNCGSLPTLSICPGPYLSNIGAEQLLIKIDINIVLIATIVTLLFLFFLSCTFIYSIHYFKKMAVNKKLLFLD